MKLLISDYDGTIKPYDKDPNKFEKYIFQKNINEINDFIKDNKFIIATGRNTESILYEIKKYNILYDYLISYNGRVIMDKDKEILNVEYINKNFLKELDNIKIKDVSFFDEFGKTNLVDDVVFIYLTLSNIKDVKSYISYCKEKYSDLQITYSFIFNTIIIRKKYNKLIGINKLLDSENINICKDDIITVGDEINDIEMLEYYNGYRMFLSNPILWKKTNKVTTSVHKLIKKIK